LKQKQLTLQLSDTLQFKRHHPTRWNKKIASFQVQKDTSKIFITGPSPISPQIAKNQHLLQRSLQQLARQVVFRHKLDSLSTHRELQINLGKADPPERKAFPFREKLDSVIARKIERLDSQITRSTQGIQVKQDSVIFNSRKDRSQSYGTSEEETKTQKPEYLQQLEQQNKKLEIENKRLQEKLRELEQSSDTL
jgi:hypothetical protein